MGWTWKMVIRKRRWKIRIIGIGGIGKEIKGIRRINGKLRGSGRI